MKTFLRLFPAALLACSSRFDDVSGPAVLLEEIIEVNGLSPPSNLAGEVRAGGEQIALAWRDNSTSETGFRIDLAERPIASFADVARWTVVPANTASWILPCEPGAEYYVRVLAVTDTLQSPPSNVIRLATASGPPAAPAILAEGYSSSQILVSWRDVAEERGYRVERSSDLGRTWGVVAALPRNSEFYYDSGLPPGSAFAYRVTAYNAFGEGVSNVAWG
ncbi:MAG: fibronectin type III domain-containing protein, partial [Planctomycetota bacterium]